MRCIWEYCSECLTSDLGLFTLKIEVIEDAARARLLDNLDTWLPVDHERWRHGLFLCLLLVCAFPCCFVCFRVGMSVLYTSRRGMFGEFPITY